jgi:hypothetical protein
VIFHLSPPDEDDLLTTEEAEQIASRLRLREPARLSCESHTKRSHANREAETGRPLTIGSPDGERTKAGPS